MSDEPSAIADLMATFVDDQIEAEREALNTAIDTDYDYAGAAGCARALMVLLETRARVMDLAA